MPCATPSDSERSFELLVEEVLPRIHTDCIRLPLHSKQQPKAPNDIFDIRILQAKGTTNLENQQIITGMNEFPDRVLGRVIDEVYA